MIPSESLDGEGRAPGVSEGGDEITVLPFYLPITEFRRQQAAAVMSEIFRRANKRRRIKRRGKEKSRSS